MTLIASFEVDHTPVLVGDLLITRPGPASSSVSTPLVHTPNSIIGDQGTRSVSGLCQKIVLLHDHLCLAWAGSLLHAKNFAENIRSFTAGKSTIGYDELQLFVNAYPRRDLENHIEFILYSWHRTGWGWFSNLKPFDLGALSNIRLSGTGTSHFIKSMDAISAAPIVGKLDGYNDLAIRALAYASLASAEQFFGGVGLLEAWGGGFEVAVFQGERLKKLGPICWLYWTCEEIGNKHYSLALRSNFMYQFYENETAVFWLDEGAGGTNKLHCVEPPYKTVEIAIARPDMIRTDILVSLVRYRLANGEIRDGCFVDRTEPAREPDLQIRNSTDTSTIMFKDAFINKLLGTMSLPSGSTVGVDAWGTKFALLVEQRPN
jgi:hypothetical protein